MSIIKFETGKIYQHGWIGDSTLKSSFGVQKRTAKTVTLFSAEPKVITRRIKIIQVNGQAVETVMPYGKFSMAPILKASNPVSK